LVSSNLHAASIIHEYTCTATGYNNRFDIHDYETSSNGKLSPQLIVFTHLG
jgi:hypothetical protein